MKLLQKNVCSVYGIKALGKHIGVKKGKKDFAIIYSKKLCSAAAVYSQNKIKAPAIEITKDHLKNGKAQAIVVISGNANVATGKTGLNDADKICKLVAEEINVKPKDVLIASTGIIGKRLPMDIITRGIVGSKKQLQKVNMVAESLLTTDTVKKEIALQVDGFKIGAIAKGSGMIHPNMATMLCFITTDADISSDNIKKYLTEAVDDSFNMLSVDMDTSTSDMVMIMSTNKKKVKKTHFKEALNHVCHDMAKRIAADGEGATKMLEVTVKGATTKESAKKIAKNIISSNLVKCAMFGNDPNWGRIIAAVGNSDVVFKEDKISIFLQNEAIVKGGKEVPNFDGHKISNLLKGKEVSIVVNLNQGKEKATAYGCDMGYNYIHINAQYGH
jgi:glutamate N-acetyltransferase/amino-acid N-acetyltransferase